MTPSRARSRSRGRLEESRLSPQSWEDEKFSADEPQPHTWRNRLLGAGAGLAAYKSFKGIFGKKDKDDDDDDVHVDDDDDVHVDDDDDGDAVEVVEGGVKSGAVFQEPIIIDDD